MRLSFEQSREKEENTWVKFPVEFEQSRENPHIERLELSSFSFEKQEKDIGFHAREEVHIRAWAQILMIFEQRDREKTSVNQTPFWVFWDSRERKYVLFVVEFWADQRKIAHVKPGVFKIK